jgi:hypothetical protein
MSARVSRREVSTRMGDGRARGEVLASAGVPLALPRRTMQKGMKRWKGSPVIVTCIVVLLGLG